MAKSSINFQPSTKGNFEHNDRTVEPDYLLPQRHRLKNEVDISALEAKEKMNSLYTEAKENYHAYTGQKLQAKSYSWEALVNLNKEHDLDDVKKLANELENETGFTTVQIAIHRDEGRIKKDKQGNEVAIYNYHAHVTFFTLDKETGVNLYRKDITSSQRREIEKDIFENHKDIKKGEAGSPERKVFNKLVRDKKNEKDFRVMDTKRLSKIQTMNAKSLNMERGKVSVKEEAEKLGVDQDLNPAERLGHKQYKKVAKEKDELKKELVKLKDLKKTLAEEKEEFKELGARRDDYAKFEQISKELQQERKEKKLTHEKLDNALNEIRELKNKLQTNELEKEELKNENVQLKEENQTLKQKYNDLKKFVQEIPNKLLDNAKKTYKQILEKIEKMKDDKEHKDIDTDKERRLAELYKKKEELQNKNNEKDR